MLQKYCKLYYADVADTFIDKIISKERHISLNVDTINSCTTNYRSFYRLFQICFELNIVYIFRLSFQTNIMLLSSKTVFSVSGKMTCFRRYDDLPLTVKKSSVTLIFS